MKSWETRWNGRTIRVVCDGTFRDTTTILVDCLPVAERTSGWLASENDVAGQWTSPEGQAHTFRAWVGSGMGGTDCKVWVDAELVFEDNFFTRAAGLVRSARRAAETAFS